MKIQRHVVVFDARDIRAESAFWAGLLGGVAHADNDHWHSVSVDGAWVIGVQLAPDHARPLWPTGPQQQQVHLDLHVDDLAEAERRTVELGGKRLQGRRRPADNPGGNEMHSVYASPAGHPFCLGTH